MGILTGNLHDQCFPLLQHHISFHHHKDIHHHNNHFQHKNSHQRTHQQPNHLYPDKIRQDKTLSTNCGFPPPARCTHNNLTCKPNNMQQATGTSSMVLHHTSE